MYSVYDHLDFAARGIQHLQFSVLEDAWIVIFPILSIILLVSSSLNVIINPLRARLVAILALIVAMPYYMFLLCIFSFLLFSTPKGLIGLAIPMMLLCVTAIYSSIALSQYKPGTKFSDQPF
jgi:hypothetical protein